MTADNPIKLIFSVLTTYERHGWVHPSILQFFCELPFQHGYAYRMIPVHNFLPAAAGRNLLCQSCKDADVDWIVMIDNDMYLDNNFLKTLNNAPADASIIVPAFYMWTQNDLKLTLCWGMDVPPDGITQLTPGFHSITKCGTGAIFIKPEVFRALEYPYFRYTYNENGSQTGTEDIQFCEAAANKGFKIYGNADIKVGHYHSVELGSLWKWAEKAYGYQKKLLDTPDPVGALSTP